MTPSDPDLATIVRRIMDNELDLQPHFQRGEVWSPSKKRRLIDSIMRDWHVPPIHVIQNEDSEKEEVLDGQQRLAAIRDFVLGVVPIDGTIEPLDLELEALDGLTFKDLPEKYRRRFNNFTIRVFRLTDFRPEEPGELFFRLNQPANLTPAEQRNAFFGHVRTQIKDLVLGASEGILCEDALGFSNHRMSYDDVVARLCIAVERGTLRTKITSADMSSRYRGPQGLEVHTVEQVRKALRALAPVRRLRADSIRFNKATLFSWLALAVGLMADGFDVSWLPTFVNDFEVIRAAQKSGSPPASQMRLSPTLAPFTDRATARVADVSSVLLRDVVLWMWLSDSVLGREKSERLTMARQCIELLPVGSDASTGESAERVMLEFVDTWDAWGNFR